MNTIIFILDLVGTFAFAASGAVLAVKRDMDLFGVLVLSVVTATGGGLLRDMIVGRIPPAVFNHMVYLAVSCGTGILVFFFYSWIKKVNHLILFFDAVGLGVFTIIGISVGLDYHFKPISSLILGMLTGVGGGMIRDILTARIPLILQKDVYASASLLGGLLYLLLRKINLPDSFSVIISILCIIFIRLFSLKYHVHLPRATSEKRQ